LKKQNWSNEENKENGLNDIRDLNEEKFFAFLWIGTTVLEKRALENSGKKTKIQFQRVKVASYLRSSHSFLFLFSE